MRHLITQNINDKSLVWFASQNQYAVFNTVTASILLDIDDAVPLEQIGNSIAQELDIPYEKAIDFVIDIEQKIYKPNTLVSSKPKELVEISKEIEYQVTNFYKINELVFKVDFQTEEEAFWIHPKFAHLQIDSVGNFDFNYQVYTDNKFTFLFIDEVYIGSWSLENVHYFQGKFSMELVQSIHQKTEDEWLGVFHASAVGDGKKSILFLGDSGNGKSTSLSLLQASGLTCIADDFVPVDAEKQEVYSFPSAISIKKNSVPVLIDLYPELESSAEYHLKLLNKIVRYLPPNNADYTKHLPCKALVFIKYVPDSDIQVQSISNIEAFEKLVPDSWLSPKKENAQQFLNWFAQLPCYQIIYSDNDKMVSTVKQLFKDEL